MAKVHLNPTTGNPGYCRAVKRCPFGLSPEAHYESLQEARQAFEQQEEASQRLQTDATRLAKVVSYGREVMGNDGLWAAPWNWADKHGFTFLALGSQRAVFRSPQGSEVLKLVASEAFTDEELMQAEEEALAKVPLSLLEEKGLRLLPHSYLKLPTGGVVAVQPYLAPPRYREFTWDEATREQGHFLKDLEAGGGEGMGLSDFTEENAMIDTSTGEVVLFDCLAVADHLYDHQWSPEE